MIYLCQQYILIVLAPMRKAEQTLDAIHTMADRCREYLKSKRAVEKAGLNVRDLMKQLFGEQKPKEFLDLDIPDECVDSILDMPAIRFKAYLRQIGISERNLIDVSRGGYDPHDDLM